MSAANMNLNHTRTYYFQRTGGKFLDAHSSKIIIAHLVQHLK